MEINIPKKPSSFERPIIPRFRFLKPWPTSPLGLRLCGSLLMFLNMSLTLPLSVLLVAAAIEYLPLIIAAPGRHFIITRMFRRYTTYGNALVGLSLGPLVLVILTTKAIERDATELIAPLLGVLVLEVIILALLMLNPAVKAWLPARETPSRLEQLLSRYRLWPVR